MMHLLVEDIQPWYQSIKDSAVESEYNISMTDIVENPWGMLDFVVFDPSGDLWRFAENI